MAAYWKSSIWGGEGEPHVDTFPRTLVSTLDNLTALWCMEGTNSRGEEGEGIGPRGTTALIIIDPFMDCTENPVLYQHLAPPYHTCKEGHYLSSQMGKVKVREPHKSSNTKQ